jgi:hypothetical protein
MGSINRGTMFQDWPWAKAKLYLKNNYSPRAGDVAQVEEHLFTKLKVLNSKPTHPRKKDGSLLLLAILLYFLLLHNISPQISIF